MPFQIPDEFVGFVQQEVSSGRYSSETDVVLAALSLLKRDREEANLALGEAIDEWQRGEGTPVDEAFAKLRTKLGITK